MAIYRQAQGIERAEQQAKAQTAADKQAVERLRNADIAGVRLGMTNGTRGAMTKARLMVMAMIGNALVAPGSAQQTPDGWYGTEYRQCTERTTVGITECLGEQTAVWERRLDDAYWALSAALECVRATTEDRARELAQAARP